ncbi:ComEC/Rec2 family competence protein [Caldanaerobacter subterraneus]|uniref:Competence protein ComE n=2 Tax=Caldanaerobacter subterraneus TaxID=911092 RepID=U5CY18_CALSX|nr:MBL fold metallo-hydrolase [Caldanaerobacter subterraneus]ERM92882.1 competence protein ComE [Caldanaerobacter subterraneus subsp. yonseiensis KB-1]NNG67215.1 MBL fold metallo-hydrolase [Caldanaerobacter subterraneus]
MFRRRMTALFTVMLLIFTFSGCTSFPHSEFSNAQKSYDSITDNCQLPAISSEDLSSKLVVSFIDVGQGDSIFIKTPSDKTMLIDAGTPEMGERVVNYIKKQGVRKIDVLVGTHPHTDHIGGLPEVIQNFDISKFYMPKVTTTTSAFENVLKAAKAKKLPIYVAKAGVTLYLGTEIEAKMLAPNSSYYEDLNNYSAVIKITYGDTAFLFTGDAEKESEREMLNENYNLKADVLKVGHHGSSSSSSWSFLKEVRPKYAVISCGKNNEYGHPHRETLEKLSELGITVYRTDECGTIVAVSDGKTVSFFRIK